MTRRWGTVSSGPEAFLHTVMAKESKELGIRPRDADLYRRSCRDSALAHHAIASLELLAASSWDEKTNGRKETRGDEIISHS
ncbi:hypothetical protein E2562_025539, partial [Oryza meyeriana var. granulata]